MCCLLMHKAHRPPSAQVVEARADCGSAQTYIKVFPKAYSLPNVFSMYIVQERLWCRSYGDLSGQYSSGV